MYTGWVCQSTGVMTTHKPLTLTEVRRELISLQCMPSIIWRNLHVCPELCSETKQTQPCLCCTLQFP